MKLYASQFMKKCTKLQGKNSAGSFTSRFIDNKAIIYWNAPERLTENN